MSQKSATMMVSAYLIERMPAPRAQRSVKDVDIDDESEVAVLVDMVDKLTDDMKQQMNPKG